MEYYSPKIPRALSASGVVGCLPNHRLTNIIYGAAYHSVIGDKETAAMVRHNSGLYILCYGLNHD